MKTEKPFSENLSFKEAFKTALDLSEELVTETALAYLKSEECQPLNEEKKWAVVIAGDCDKENFVVASDVRFDSGHSSPDNPWQVHRKTHANPYR